MRGAALWGMVRRSLQHSPPGPATVSAYACGCTGHAHRQACTRLGWHGGNRSATGQGHTWMVRQPFVDGLRPIDLAVIDHDSDAFALRSGIGVLQGLRQVSEQRLGLARTLTMVQRAGGLIKRPCQVGFA
jgi:hypothetical protein